MKLPILRHRSRPLASSAFLISLFLVSPVFANCNFSADTEEIIRGSVYIESNNNNRRDRFEAGIADVNVSNGCEVVQTDGGGNYRIPIHATQILFISKPAEFDLPLDDSNIPQFFYRHYPDGTPTEIAGTSIEWAWPVIEPTGPLPSVMNFGLLAREQSGSQFTAHAFADSQAKYEIDQDMLREDLVNPLIGNPYGVEFGITVGDVVYDNLGLYDRHKAMMALMGIPQWNLPGNHDINFASPDAIFANETFKAHFGPTYYSFNQGNVHFVALNNVEYAGYGKQFGNSGYRGYIPEHQIEWLAQDLANVSPSKLIVIATHVPLISEADDDQSEPHSGPGTQNFSRLLEVLAPFSNIYGIAGHDTSNSWKVEINHSHGWQGQPWIAHTLAEVRGSGWSKGLSDARGVRDSLMEDGNPNGFYVLRFDDTTVTPDFIPFPFGPDAQQRLRITLDPPLSEIEGGSINRGAVQPNTKVVVNLFDGGARDSVWASVDGGEAQTMIYAVRTDPFMERLDSKYQNTDYQYSPAARSAHIWEMNLPAGLGEGLHTIEIQTEDEFGQMREGVMTFEIIDQSI
ncbi:MAG: calcineurin-like phosphoesterase C-terminal domain-containing protein [Gammaproteobacteria bacterium]|nr:calcineurin-like phosphoesterase C-terminal domain-containing protein [Gammaproteobacteria bacterium]